MVIYTVGHSTRSIDELIAILSEAGVTRVADVRAFPMSRRHPHFNKDALSVTLSAAGIDYRHMPALGGRRKAQKGAPSHNGLWKVEAFRNYADYAETAAFADALRRLLAMARRSRCAIMCAEAVWWRCHRRIVADYAITRGARVVHIFGPTRSERATRTPFARVDRRRRTLYYPLTAAARASSRRSGTAS